MRDIHRKHFYSSAQVPSTEPLRRPRSGRPRAETAFGGPLPTQVPAANQAPDVALAVVSARWVSDPVVVSTLGTTDVDGTIMSGVVDWGDGSTTPWDAAQLEYKHSYAAIGVYTITFRVSDNKGATGEAMIRITITINDVPDPPPVDPPPDPLPENQPPELRVAYVSGRFRGDPFVFSLAGTADLDGTIVSGVVNWGDGVSEALALPIAASIAHVYNTVNTYSMTITVVDNDGAVATVTRTNTVEAPVPNQVPVASFSKMSGVYAGETHIFVITASDPDGTIASWSISWGDGSANDSGTGVPPATRSHVYATAGTRTATLTVVDNGGASTVKTAGVVTSTVPPPTGGDNAYYDALVARPETVFAYPMRSAADIDPYVRYISGLSGSWTYDGAEDAARCTMFTDKESAPQMYLPIALDAAGQLVIIYDWKASSSWVGENGLAIHKMENILRTGNKIWFELNNRYPTVVSGGVIPAGGTILSRFRPYSAQGLEAPHFTGDATGYTKTDAFGAVSYDGDAVKPIVSNYVAPREVWVRKMVVLDQSALNGFVQVSTYACDETHDPVLILDQCGVGMVNTERPVVFDLEVNTSKARVGPEVHCWYRNVWVGRGVADPLALLVRP